MAVEGHVRPTITVSPRKFSLGTAAVGDSVGKRLLVRARRTVPDQGSGVVSISAFSVR